MSQFKLRMLTLAFFVTAVAIRFLPHGVNFTAIGALAMFAGCYLTVSQGMLLSLGALAVTDLIGQTFEIQGMGFYHRPTMLAVYISFALPSLLGWALRGRANLLSVPAGAIASAAIFFVATNFAAWLDPEMPYARTLAGLIECYIAAIPFALNTFVGSLLFSVLFFAIHARLSQPVANVAQQSAS